MLLLLSSHKPWNATYTNESGQALFKCESKSPSNTLRRRAFTLYRTLAPSELGWRGEQGETSSSTVSEEAKYLKDEFEVLGQIVYDVWNMEKSVLKFGQDLSVEGMVARDMFSKAGWGFYGRNRTFTAPNGEQFTWSMGAASCSLYPVAEGDLQHVEPILKFQQGTMGFFSKRRPSTLEIKDGYEGVLPSFLLTFIYMERVRTERETATQQAAAAS
ncbi:hypothetical protein CVT24_002822 [Panaeolus cyanescens]|uniref:DUF6593 domain-containing protein n=1 Tax=Panaeolus cyanescens TaxID=181874 RepID=A0A409YRF2_9AGAR|nr:hypothetical protein CVT24_002822 [Panaeolus cyanescens]